MVGTIRRQAEVAAPSGLAFWARRLTRTRRFVCGVAHATSMRYVSLDAVREEPREAQLLMDIGVLPRRCRPFSLTETNFSKAGQNTTPGRAGVLLPLRNMRAGLIWER